MALACSEGQGMAAATFNYANTTHKVMLAAESERSEDLNRVVCGSVVLGGRGYEGIGKYFLVGVYHI